MALALSPYGSVQAVWQPRRGRNSACAPAAFRPLPHAQESPGPGEAAAPTRTYPSVRLFFVVRADGPAAGHSARVRLTSTVSTSARIAPWFVAHPYWVAPEENSRMLASCELRVVAPTCNVKPTGRALSNVR